MTVNRLIAFRRLTNFAIGSALIVLSTDFITPSQNPDIFGLSYFRLAFFVVVAGVGLAFIASTLIAKIEGVFFVISMNIFSVVALVEIVLRLFSTGLPFEVVSLLPTDARRELLAQRGGLTEVNVVGEGLVFFFREGAEFPATPWVRLDENGYRNPQMESDQADVLIVGDSTTISVISEVDLGHLFRQSGISSYNLGFGGYGPGQYRDSYRRFIDKGNVKHKVVLLNLCGCNDLNETLVYQRLEDTGETWREYLGAAPKKDMIFGGSLWSVSVFVNSLMHLRQWWGRQKVGDVDLGPVEIQDSQTVPFMIQASFWRRLE